MPADQRSGLDDEERVSPGKDLGQQHQHQAGRIGGTPRRDLPLPVEGQLLPQEEVLGRQRGACADSPEAEPKDIDPQRGSHLTEMPQRRNSLHDASSPTGVEKENGLDSREGKLSGQGKEGIGIIAQHKYTVASGGPYRPPGFLCMSVLTAAFFHQACPVMRYSIALRPPALVSSINSARTYSC